MSIHSVAIVGAGIAGLTAALSFARLGIRTDIIEQAPQLTDVGAGLQMSPNATYILDRLGVLPELENHWQKPSRIGLASGTSLRPLAFVPAGQFALERWGSPYGVLHRSTLQQALLTAVLHASSLCHLHLGQRLEDTTPQSIGALTGRAPDLIVGADGVWSRTRSRVPDAPETSFSGNVAWRFTIPDESAPDFLDRNNVTAFLGPNSHLVGYPLREIGGFNVVAITAGNSPGETWGTTGTAAQKRMMLRHFHRWHDAIVDMLEKANQPNFWPLFQTGKGRWHNGRDTVLIGDAAHAMMPFAAQGAAMAIEDAFVLAGKVAGTPLPQALASFEAERSARATKVRDRGAFNKFAYHARGPFRLGRDVVLSLRKPESLAADLDWLYGFKAKG